MLELLPRLRVLNLYNNKVGALPDLRRSNIEELNVAFNPITFLNVDLLPPHLKAISISGLEV